MDSQAQNELTKLSMALLQVQRDWWTEASSKASDSGRRLAELNMNTMKDSLAQTNAAMQDLAAAKDPQQWMAIANAQFQPRLERALSYSRQWVDIASSFQAQMSQIAQSEVTEVTEKTSALIDGLVSTMPEEAKPTVAMMKTVIDGAKVSYEQLTKTTQQMAEALDAGRIAAMKQASDASHKMTTGKAKHH